MPMKDFCRRAVADATDGARPNAHGVGAYAAHVQAMSATEREARDSTA
jgi:hypothetical protein